jgi:hypothetical protein
MAFSILKTRPSALDLALAGFAGAAFAFAAFFMPEWRLTQLSLATGLADIFPPARPPLGFTARALFAVIVGLLAGGGSLLLLRLAERKPVPKREATEADAPPAPIRLRRADAHPDAPPRRPLAARDLGEPEVPMAFLAPPAQEPREEELVLAPEAEVPAFLVEQEPETAEPEQVEAEAEPEAPLVWPQPIVEPEPEAVEAPAPEAVAEAAPEPEDDPSISKLMQRLEFGLARKERAAPLDPAAVAPPADGAVGHRLRSAIGDLQKLAARG